MKRFLYILVSFLFVIGLFSCKKNDSTTNLSSVAQLKAFSFMSNDSFPGLKQAKFVVLERLDTGLVYNQDSILFGTKLTRVVPKFTFVTTPGAAQISLPDTSVVLTGTDTLDFSRGPIYLTVTSSDLTKKKVYEIRPSVHQVDPDLFQWTCLAPSVFEGDCEQQTVLLQDQFVMLVNNGFTTRVYLSVDGATWESKGVPAGLPTSCDVRSVVSDGKMLYYTEQNVLYTSGDALSWSSSDYSSADYHILTMLMAYNDSVWAVVERKEDDQLLLATMQEGGLVPNGVVLDANFPVSSFATTQYLSPSLRRHAIIMGGYDRLGQPCNSRWCIEYVPTQLCYRLQNLTVEQPQFEPLTGASIVWYNHALFLFGGINKDAQLREQPILVSYDEGMNWTMPDTVKCKLPDTYAIRLKQSAIVRDKYIYLVGGRSRVACYSDVYRGRLNSIDWD